MAPPVRQGRKVGVRRIHYSHGASVCFRTLITCLPVHANGCRSTCTFPFTCILPAASDTPELAGASCSAVRVTAASRPRIGELNGIGLEHLPRRAAMHHLEAADGSPNTPTRHCAERCERWVAKASDERVGEQPHLELLRTSGSESPPGGPMVELVRPRSHTCCHWVALQGFHCTLLAQDMLAAESSDFLTDVRYANSSIHAVTRTLDLPPRTLTVLDSQVAGDPTTDLPDQAMSTWIPRWRSLSSSASRNPSLVASRKSEDISIS